MVAHFKLRNSCE